MDEQKHHFHKDFLKVALENVIKYGYQRMQNKFQKTHILLVHVHPMLRRMIQKQKDPSIKSFNNWGHLVG